MGILGSFGGAGTVVAMSFPDLRSAVAQIRSIQWPTKRELWSTSAITVAILAITTMLTGAVDTAWLHLMISTTLKYTKPHSQTLTNVLLSAQVLLALAVVGASVRLPAPSGSVDSLFGIGARDENPRPSVSERRRRRQLLGIAMVFVVNGIALALFAR